MPKVPGYFVKVSIVSSYPMKAKTIFNSLTVIGELVSRYASSRSIRLRPTRDVQTS